MGRREMFHNFSLLVEIDGLEFINYVYSMTLGTGIIMQLGLIGLYS
jgi:hypothetical protein